MWLLNPYGFGESDPFFANVSLLLSGYGANGSTSIVDSSPSPKTVTAFGNAQISTAQSPYGGSSIALDGTGDYLGFPLQTFSGDFTIECLFYTNNNTRGMLFSGLPNNYQIAIRTGTSSEISIVAISDPNVFIYGSSPSGMNSLTWHHFAFSRAGSSSRVFLNGLQVGPTLTSYTQVFQVATIGAFRNSNTFQNSELNGYLSQIRLTSVGRYTANFTPPTAPFPVS